MWSGIESNNSKKSLTRKENNMSKKRLLEATKQEFVYWFANQPNSVRFELATTPMDAKTQLARFRRLYIKTKNDLNYRALKIEELKEGKD